MSKSNFNQFLFMRSDLKIERNHFGQCCRITLKQITAEMKKPNKYAKGNLYYSQGQTVPTNSFAQFFIVIFRFFTFSLVFLKNKTEIEVGMLASSDASDWKRKKNIGECYHLAILLRNDGLVLFFSYSIGVCAFFFCFLYFPK